MQSDTDTSKRDRETPIYGFTEKLLAYLWFCFIAAALIYPILNGSTVQEIMSLLNDGGFPLVAFILGPPFILLYRRDLGNFVETYRNATTITDDIKDLGDSITAIGKSVSTELKKDTDEIGKGLKDSLRATVDLVVSETSEKVKEKISSELQKQLSDQVREFSGGVRESVDELLQKSSKDIEKTVRVQVAKLSASDSGYSTDEGNEDEPSDLESGELSVLQQAYQELVDEVVNIFNPLHTAIYANDDNGSVPLVKRGGGNRAEIVREYLTNFTEELQKRSEHRRPISIEDGRLIFDYMAELFDESGIKKRKNIEEVQRRVERLREKRMAISVQFSKAQEAVA